MNHQVTKTVRVGNLMAEVKVMLIPDDGAWGPYISATDAEKLERVRLALKAGDKAAAAKEAKIFELRPVAAE